MEPFPEKRIAVSPARVLHILPAFGTPGVCADYDEDCVDVRDKLKCFQHDYFPGCGICPFLD